MPFVPLNEIRSVVTILNLVPNFWLFPAKNSWNTYSKVPVFQLKFLEPYHLGMVTYSLINPANILSILAFNSDKTSLADAAYNTRI